MGATASVFSDQRFRGFSVSDGYPVLIGDLAYDDSSGFYADASGSVVFRPGPKPEPLSAQLVAGYAKQFPTGTTIDVGVTHSSYSRYSNGRRGQSYNEAYVGVAHGILSSRIFVSPDYFTSGRWTAYGEVNANLSAAREWRLEAHLGMLTILRTPGREPYQANLDWRLGVSRELGRLSLHAALTGHGRAPQPFGSALRQSPARSALVLGATMAL